MDVPQGEEDRDLDELGLPVRIPDAVDVDDAAVGRRERDVGPPRDDPLRVAEGEGNGSGREEERRRQWRECEGGAEPDRTKEERDWSAY